MPNVVPEQKKAPGIASTIRGATRKRTGSGKIVDEAACAVKCTVTVCAATAHGGKLCQGSHGAPERPEGLVPPLACEGGGRPPDAPFSDAALVSSAYGHTFSGKKAQESFQIQVYPSGVKVCRTVKLQIEPPQGFKRGNIEEFSAEAARRLREWCVTQEVRGRNVWAFTFTVHRAVGEDEWFEITKRFRTTVSRRGWAATWRVELQRRKVPHIHAAMWLPDGCTFKQVRDAWLDATRESKDRDARKYAVMGRRIDSHGWAVYLALHDGKKKGAQLGWVGKQWGIWGRTHFTERAPSEVSRELPVELEVAVRRFLRRLMLAKGSRATLGRGGFLRCMDGRTMERFLACWDAGRISHVSGAIAKRGAGPRDLVTPAFTCRVGGRVVAEVAESVRSPLP